MNGEGGPRQAAHTITIDTPSLDQDDLNLGYRLGYGAGYKQVSPTAGMPETTNCKLSSGCTGPCPSGDVTPNSKPSAATRRRGAAGMNAVSARHCVRHAQATRNWAKYRSPDFPGGGR